MPRHAVRRFFALLALAPALAGLAAAPAAQAAPSEFIRRFHSDITVHADGSMDVRETIAVHAAGVSIRRGIYRDFPVKYQDRWGNRMVVGFTVLGAKRDGSPEKVRTDPRQNGVRVYLGDPDKLIEPGDYTYEIAYRTNRQIGFFADHDELYWNVTGSGWTFLIYEASADVRLPASVPSAALRMEGYTGPQGSREQAFQAESPEPGHAVFRASRPLGAYEGLTIALSFPKGVVRPLARADKARYFVQDNKPVLGGLIGLLLILAYYLMVWDRVGRDPSKGTIIPRYLPPDNLSPALMRTILRMGPDNKALTAAIIDLAVKGHLLINDKKGTYTLTKASGGIGMPSLEEKQVLQMLEPNGSIDLKQKNYSAIGSAVTAVERSLEVQAGSKYFLKNHGYGMAGLAATGLLLWVLWEYQASAGVFVLTVLGVALNTLFFQLLKARTASGRKLLDAIEGFKLYLGVAEKDRLNLLNPPERTPELFERYLPYALALEVEQKWAEQFADVFAAAAKSGSQDYQPSWYTGSHWNPSRPARFTSAMGSSLSSAISSSSTPPGSSSGGGGGGSSGGGGGGGGGGGW